MTNQIDKTTKEIPQIIQLANLNAIDGVTTALLNGSCKIEDTDDTGMTALQHACYKGQLQMAKLLLDYGADVNSDYHNHSYSCLHFGALSGNIEIVAIILDAGAKRYHVNSLKRTASQMAAFVGNHQIVSLINNFLPIGEIEYFTVPRGLEKVGKLPVKVAKPLHDLLMQSNLHPVNIALSVERDPLFLTDDSLVKCSSVLSIMCDKEAKRKENTNEILCMKFHYLSYVLCTLDKELTKAKLKIGSDPSKKDEKLMFELIIKKWLLGRGSDGFEEHMNFYIRDAIKAFPFADIPIFIQICRNIVSKNEEVWALDILTGAINGQRGFNDDVTCTTCGTVNDKAKKCGKCKSVQYCDKTCQRLHWFMHKNFCEKLKIQYEKRQEGEESRKDEESDRLLEEQMANLSGKLGN